MLGTFSFYTVDFITMHWNTNSYTNGHLLFIVDIQSGTPFGEIEFIVIHENTGLWRTPRS